MVTKTYAIAFLFGFSFNLVNSQAARLFQHEVVTFVERCLDPYCDRLKLTLNTSTKTIVFDLQKVHGLISDDYFEQIGNNEPVRVLDGRSVVEVSGMNCFYESVNPTIIGSFSFCDTGIEGSFTSPQGSFILHFDNDLQETCLFKSNNLPFQDRSEYLGNNDELMTKWKPEIFDRSMEELSARSVSHDRPLYLEILVVVDYEGYKNVFQSSVPKVKKFVTGYAKVANMVYMNYDEPVIKTSIVLIGLIIWTEGDPVLFDRQGRCKQNSHPCTISDRLDDMVHYNARHLYPKYHQDTTVFFTGKSFPGSRAVAGVAYQGLTCNAPELSTHLVLLYDNDIRAFNRIYHTALHEMGHNLGFEDNIFDINDRCANRTKVFQKCYGGCPNSTCIMQACEGEESEKKWDECSRKIFTMRKEDGKYWCMHNQPNLSKTNHTFLAHCGNGIIEAGEKCDCNVLDEKCWENCDWETCNFKKAGCKCAGGPCCNSDTCQFKSSNETCESSSDEACTRNLKCTGMSLSCPDEVGIEEKSCDNDGNKYCLKGSCVFKCPQNCFNSGKCIGNIKDGYNCDCYTMYYGVFCQTRLNIAVHFAFGALLGVIAFFWTIILFRLLELSKSSWRYQRVHEE